MGQIGARDKRAAIYRKNYAPKVLLGVYTERAGITAEASPPLFLERQKYL